MIQKKICMVGAFGVGKTSLVARYVFSRFSEKYQTTIGVKIDKKVLEVEGQPMTMVLWDLAGEDALTTVRPAQLKGSAGFLLVADGTRRNTLDAAKSLLERAREGAGDVPFLLVLNKADIRDQWEVTDDDIRALEAESWPMMFASAKDGSGVEELFHKLAAAMLKEHRGESWRTADESA